MEIYADKALNQLQELPVEKGLNDFENLVTYIINRKK
jgi:geranylgeranyl pyrophosphate synthase